MDSTSVAAEGPNEERRRAEDKSRRWLIGLLGLGLILVIAFGFQSLIFPPKEAHMSFLKQPLPNYQLLDSQGEEVLSHSVIDQYGADELLVTFWATYCEPCLRELPLLQRALPKLNKQGVDVMLVNYDPGQPEKVRREVLAWMISERLVFTTFFDFKEEFLNHLHVAALPFSLRVRTSDKKIVWMKLGELEWKDLPL